MALEQVQRQAHHRPADAPPVLLVLEAPAVLADLQRSDAAILLTRLAHTIVTGERHFHDQQQSEEESRGRSGEGAAAAAAAGASSSSAPANIQPVCL